MARYRLEADWTHTAEIQAAIINSNPFRKGRPVTSDQLNPFKRKKAASGGRGMAGFTLAEIKAGLMPAKK